MSASPSAFLKEKHKWARKAKPFTLHMGCCIYAENETPLAASQLFQQPAKPWPGCPPGERSQGDFSGDNTVGRNLKCDLAFLCNTQFALKNRGCVLCSSGLTCPIPLHSCSELVLPIVWPRAGHLTSSRLQYDTDSSHTSLTNLDSIAWDLEMFW